MSKYTTEYLKSVFCVFLARCGGTLHDSLRWHLSCDLLGTFQQGVVDVFGAGNLRLDHAEVLPVRHGLRLDSVWLGGRRDEVGGVLGAVYALREALICQSLHKLEKCESGLESIDTNNICMHYKELIVWSQMHFYNFCCHLAWEVCAKYCIIAIDFYCVFQDQSGSLWPTIM